ncbi:hypothetical protein SDJN03_07844, partial [Cucurbita argyrosperma subsp. sororia]
MGLLQTHWKTTTSRRFELQSRLACNHHRLETAAMAMAIVYYWFSCSVSDRLAGLQHEGEVEEEENEEIEEEAPKDEAKIQVVCVFF